MSRSPWIIGAALLLLGAPAARAGGADDGPRPKGPVNVEVQAGAISVPGQPGGVQVQVQAGEGRQGGARVQVAPGGIGPIRVEVNRPWVSVWAPQPVELGEYWLGLECSPARGALRTQLGLPEDQGLVVERLVPDGPAAKAEIQQHDVLLKAGATPLKNAQDLIDAVQAAEGKELPIELIRRAQPKHVAVTPAKRPEEARPAGPWAAPYDEALDAYKKALEGLDQPGNEDVRRRTLRFFERMRPGEVLRGPLRWQFFGPGTILPPDAWPRPPLPGNMSITISKHGDQPAQITVKQDGQKWEVTEEELDKLPKDIRPHVERMLGRVVGDPLAHPEHEPDLVAPDVTAPLPPEVHPEGLMEKQLDDMNRQIEELRKSLEILRGQQPPHQPD